MDIARSIKGLKLRTLFFQGLKVLLPALLTVIHTAILSLIFIELLLVISKSSRPGPLFPQKCLIHPERLKNYQLLVPYRLANFSFRKIFNNFDHIFDSCASICLVGVSGTGLCHHRSQSFCSLAGSCGVPMLQGK